MHSSTGPESSRKMCATIASPAELGGDPSAAEQRSFGSDAHPLPEMGGDV